MDHSAESGRKISIDSTGYQGENEYQLMRAIADKDEHAFSEIYQRYHWEIYNYLYKLIGDPSGADDIMQEVFLAVWKGAAKFQQRSSIKTWIYRIAYKQAISWLRKHPVNRELFELDEIPIADNELEESVIISIQHSSVQQAMNFLAPKQRAVLELAFDQGMSYVEIADVLSCPVGTVKSRMSYALRNLNRKLLQIGIDHGETGSSDDD